jgi:hypothetical protein
VTVRTVSVSYTYIKTFSWVVINADRYPREYYRFKTYWCWWSRHLYQSFVVHGKSSTWAVEHTTQQVLRSLSTATQALMLYRAY